LQQKFALLAGDDVASTQEILEAISLLKVRKQNGFNSNLDFLASFDSQVEVLVLHADIILHENLRVITCR
jgi:hypothetical protein